MNVETPETVKAPAEAESYAEFKAIRSGEKVEKVTPPPTAGAASEEDAGKQDQKETSGPDAGASGESGEDADPSKETQDKQAKPKRDKGAEARISELTARAKRAEEEREELRRKLAEKDRASQPAPQTKSEEPKPKADEGDPEPELEHFDTYEKYVRAAARWEARQEQKEAAKRTAEENAKQQVRESLARRAAEARTKYSDFDTVTAGDQNAGTGLVLTPPMQTYIVESDAGLDVAYHLGKHPEERARIAALTPARQIAELGKIEDRIAGTPHPEKPKPPVSKAPPPPRTVGGSEAPPAKSTAEAMSFAEHKRLRNGR